MEALLRVVKKNPLQKSKSKHQKLGEGWGENENRDTVREGVTFYVKYLGSTLVEELLEEGQSYGEGISANAVKAIVSMAKAAGKKLPKMSISISNSGIRVMNLVTQQVQAEFGIHRIAFCTADRTYDKVFAYMARNQINETMECHAFLCSKRKVAQAVTLTVAQAFNVAKEIESDFEDKKKKELENLEKRAQGSVTTVTLSNDGGREQSATFAMCTPRENGHSGMDLGDSLDPRDECSGSSPPNDIFGSTVFGDSSSLSLKTTPTKTESTSHAIRPPTDKMGFDDNFADSFSSFAQSRSQAKPNSQFTFNTGLRPEDVDDGVLQLMHGQKSIDAFGRQPSIDDLLSL